MTRCNFCGRLFTKKLHNSNIFEQIVCPHCHKAIIKKSIKIGIGILHYKENEDTILKSLISIDNQKHIDFNNFEVIIVTDEGGVELDKNYINSRLKNFIPKYFDRERKYKTAGPGGTRNSIIEHLDTEYIMFIDGDDRLSSNKVLHRIYTKINKYKPEIYCSSMREELKNGKFVKYLNLMCLSMMHGKVFKKEIFDKYNIHFDEKIPIEEDLRLLVSFYNVCDSIYFDDKFVSYDWLYNENSITRSLDGDNSLDTYFRCFDHSMSYLNTWYKELCAEENMYVNWKAATLMYNIFYYRVMLTSKGKLREYYLKKFFEYVIYPVDFELSDKLDKSLNRKLFKRIPYFRETYKKYKGN